MVDPEAVGTDVSFFRHQGDQMPITSLKISVVTDGLFGYLEYESEQQDCDCALIGTSPISK